MSFATSGSFPASLIPAQKKQALSNNYLNFADGTSDWAQQYLPELYEAEVERYGNRTLSGFLRMVGAEMPMTSDQVLWSEQNRLHVSYNECNAKALALTNTIQIELANANPTSNGRGNNTVAIKANQTILVADNATGLITSKCIVSSVTQPVAPATVAEILVVPYAGVALPAGLQTAGASTLNLFVYGSEFGKGSDDASMTSIEPSFTEYHNSPIIIRDKYEVNGSDAAQIGWVEIATEDGTSGYLWYLKAESETRLRFEDYMEMSLVEGEKAGHTVAMPNQTSVNLKGTEGLFAAIEARGNVYQGFAGAAAPGSGAMGDFDEILKNLDKQGAIEENMLFLQRQTALDFDDMIAAMAGGGFASTASASYGLFDNEEDMALNFGFSGFRRGSYDFYKTDWKYLNDASTRGLSKAIDGVLVPAGTSTVYDQMLGSNIRRPFLHVRYRASESEDRRYKNWITGSVGGAYTSGVDAMSVHFLTERCLVTQAANNFVLFKAV
jgi:hypothetical protein